MFTEAGIKDFRRMAAGAAIMFVAFLVVLYYRQDPAQQVVDKAKRADLVDRMRSSLALASEAEKSAVMAITDEDSQRYADQARTATADVEQARIELEKALQTGSRSDEKQLLEQFSAHFAEFQSVDRELLALAVKNTNLKAYSLAYGPAVQEIKTMDEALARLMARNSNATQAPTLLLLAASAQAAALRIQALLPPHIAEQTAKKMDELETEMSAQDQQVRRNLENLAALPSLKGDADVGTAAASYARFSDLRTQILKLSRENTNVLSLAMSLDQKRKVQFACQDGLAALKQVIMSEPIAGVDYGRPSR